MFKITQIINTNAEQVEIVPLGDVHYPSPNCNTRKFLETIQYLKDNPSTYIVLMGDLWDCIVPSDKRFEPEDCYSSIDEAYDYIFDVLNPLKKQILAILIGNHEWKIHQSGHSNLSLRLAKELGIPEKYAGMSCYIRLQIPQSIHKKSLVIYAHHGFSAGRKTGATINAIENLAQYYDADIYLMGHSHKLATTKQVRVDWAGDRDMLFCNTGTFLETATLNKTSYSERACYPPQRIGVCKIKYYPRKGKYYATE